MNKKAAIKIVLREMLAKKPSVQANISLLDGDTAVINFGKDWSYKLRLPEYDDEGDPSTEAWHNEIFAALQAIVDEHNNNITEE